MHKIFILHEIIIFKVIYYNNFSMKCHNSFNILSTTTKNEIKVFFYKPGLLCNIVKLIIFDFFFILLVLIL